VRGVGRGSGGRRLRAPLALLAAAGLALVTVVAVRTVQAGSGGCNRALTLTVSAAPDIAPVVRAAADRWTATKPRVNSECIRVQVSTAEPADVANRLAVRAGVPINVAARPVATPSDADLPAMWIPDSTAWIVRVQGVNRSAFDDQLPSIAMSPVVLAAPEPVANALRGATPHPLAPAELGALLQDPAKGDKSVKFGITEPRRDAAGLAGAIVLHGAIATNPAQLPALVAAYRSLALSPDRAAELKAFGPVQNVAPLSEQAVFAYDATDPPAPLVAVPLDAPFALDYPCAILSGKPRAVTRAAELFRQALLGYPDDFSRAGYRTPDGSTGTGFPAGHGAVAGQVTADPISDPVRVGDVLSVWTTSRAPARVLTLVDVTASMAGPVAAGSPVTRLQVLQQAATGGLRLFTDDSELGLWAFATGLDGTRDHRELVPVGRLDAAQRQRLDAAVAAAAPSPASTRGLYQSVLDAYQVMRDGYRDDRSNTIVVFTDGPNSKPGDRSLDDMQLELERLTDTTRPVRVVLLGIGPDVNLDELSAIAKTSGGKAFKVDNPADIGTIFLQALVRTGA
jgi:hypothetical protein